MPGLVRIGLLLAILFCCPITDVEAGLNKCTDGKQLTYTNEPCEKTGLTSAGPIKDAVTVMPFVTGTLKGQTGKTGKEREGNNGKSAYSSPASGVPNTDVSGTATIKPETPLAN